ncbi:MAG: LysR family transcriptional regulator [Alphaproteobacteria bacterium]|nr:LysR family transcriptional regulator [Alphaproteobacteria bacterium]
MTDLGAVDLNLLVALELLLEERSVRGAARRAHVSPSAMSHTLRRLRALLGDEVLVRAGRGMVPTPRAEALAEPVKGLLAQARAVLTDPGAFSPATLARPFRVVCTDHVSTVLLSQAEALLRREAPGVDLYVVPLVPDTMDALRQGAVDAAIGVFPEAPPEVRMRRLFTDGFVTVCRSDHPRLGDAKLSLDAFLAEPHVLVAPRGTPWGTVDEVLEARGLTRRVARTFPGFLAAMWHIVESDALLTVSRRLVATTASRLPVRVHRPPLPLADYGVMLAWHPRVDKAVEDVWLRGVLIQAAAELPTCPLP